MARKSKWSKDIQRRIPKVYKAVVIQHKKDTEEDSNIEYNIQQISKACNLSLRHTNNLKYGARKGRTVIPL
ncbi:hypothetical protein H5410_030742 [Solanum commersonii]|uniref:Uncharacterized protein n=1 Tax=Solanum commersonii TaxID=4109 RepID=A0A9J5YJL3_SOLCO|nr:hypothetical protein H5410_030742 [Solanum commersonii]